MKQSKWMSIYLYFLLIGIIIIMLFIYNEKDVIELFDNKNNNILGGAIVTLQIDFTKLLTQFEKIEQNMEKSYIVSDLSTDLNGNNVIANLYKSIQTIKTPMYGVIDMDILQSTPKNSTTPSSNSNQIITNKTIKTDPRWNTEVLPTLTELQTGFTNLLNYTNNFLKIVPDPLPPNLKKEQIEMITMLKILPINITTINGYITDMLK